MGQCTSEDQWVIPILSHIPLYTILSPQRTKRWATHRTLDTSYAFHKQLLSSHGLDLLMVYISAHQFLFGIRSSALSAITLTESRAWLRLRVDKDGWKLSFSRIMSWIQDVSAFYSMWFRKHHLIFCFSYSPSMCWSWYLFTCRIPLVSYS